MCRAHAACTFVRAIASVRLQSLFQMVNQLLVIGWLAQEANRTGFHGACPHVFVRIASDENYGNSVTSGDQAVLQVKAAQPRHLHIGNEARGVGDLLRLENYLGMLIVLLSFGSPSGGLIALARLRVGSDGAMLKDYFKMLLTSSNRISQVLGDFSTQARTLFTMAAMIAA